MTINTERIKLSTKDSLIHISGISLLPQVALWQQSNRTPDAYIGAKVDLVEMKGIKFSRIKGQNSLSARSFDISSANIESNKTKRIDEGKKTKKQSGTTGNPLICTRCFRPYCKAYR